MKQLFTLTIFMFMLLSCVKEDNGEVGMIDNELSARSICSYIETTRLLANEDYTVIVTQCYENGFLAEIEYEIDESTSGDFYGVLDLSQNNDTIRIELINNSITSLSAPPVIEPIYSDVTTEPDYYCECNDPTAEADDCVKRSYANNYYCDGTLCKRCSVVVAIPNSSGTEVIRSHSVIILSNNFQ